MDRREFLSGAALLSAAVAGCSRSTAEQSTPGATDTMPYNAVNGEGAQALHIETVLNWIRGDAVVSGCDPSDGTNAMEVDIASGTVRVDGSNVSVSAQTVTLLTGGTDPRKDLIWIDSTGTVQVSQGIEAPYRPPDKTGFNTHQPSPPDSTGVNGAVVAEVIVDAGASDIDATPGQDLRDRRVFSNLDVDSVNTDEVNNDEWYVESGESIQTAIDAAQPVSGTVYLVDDINDGAEVHVKKGVTLDTQGHRILVTADHNGVFVDNLAAFIGTVDVDVAAYTSDGIVLDTSRSADGKYSIGGVESDAVIDATILGNNNFAGRGIAFRDNANSGITLGTSLDIEVAAFNENVLMDSGGTGSGFVNLAFKYLSSVWGVKNIYTQGAGQCASTIYGDIQSESTNSDYGIHHTAAGTLSFWGNFWDTGAYNVAAVAGGSVNLFCRDLPAATNSDGSTDMLGVSISGRRFKMFDYENQNEWAFDFGFGNLDIQTLGNGAFRLHPNGNLEPIAGAYHSIIPEDLSTRTPSKVGELAMDDGTNTTSTNAELAVGQAAGGTWHTMGGDTI